MKMDPKDNRPAKGMMLMGFPWNGTSSGIGRAMALTRHGKSEDVKQIPLLVPDPLPVVMFRPASVPTTQSGTDSNIQIRNTLTMTRNGR